MSPLIPTLACHLRHTNGGWPVVWRAYCSSMGLCGRFILNRSSAANGSGPAILVVNAGLAGSAGCWRCIVRGDDGSTVALTTRAARGHTRRVWRPERQLGPGLAKVVPLARSPASWQNAVARDRDPRNARRCLEIHKAPRGGLSAFALTRRAAVLTASGKAR